MVNYFEAINQNRMNGKTEKIIFIVVVIADLRSLY